jgi:tripartite-type tricarboxylate transporter receptor subunit TctC
MRRWATVAITVLASAGLCALLAAPLAAQDYPNKPIILIVPFAAGGPSDTFGRLVADHMGRTLGQQIIIENVGGAGGTLGAERAAKAAADGYTLLTHHSGLTAAPALYSNLRYDARTAFEPLGLVNTGPMVLISKTGLAARSAQELIAWLKAEGEKATVGYAGVGSNSYICATLLKQLIGIRPAMVAYRGTGPAMNDLVGGQIDVLCDQATTAVPQIQGGTVRAYVVTSPERLASIKDVPSAREAGLPDFSVTIWNGLYAPKGVPAEVVEKVNAALAKMLADPAILERFAATGTGPFPPEMRSPAAHAKFIAGEFERFARMFQAVAAEKVEAK